MNNPFKSKPRPTVVVRTYPRVVYHTVEGIEFEYIEPQKDLDERAKMSLWAIQAQASVNAMKAVTPYFIGMGIALIGFCILFAVVFIEIIPILVFFDWLLLGIGATLHCYAVYVERETAEFYTLVERSRESLRRQSIEIVIEEPGKNL